MSLISRSSCSRTVKDHLYDAYPRFLVAQHRLSGGIFGELQVSRSANCNRRKGDKSESIKGARNLREPQLACENLQLSRDLRVPPLPPSVARRPR